MLKSGELVRVTSGQGGEIGLVLSVDPATDCCGFDPCDHGKWGRVYSPKARVLWQSGTKAGQESILMAHLLEPVGEPVAVDRGAEC